MVRVLIVAQDNAIKADLRTGLARYDVSCTVTSYNNGVRDAIADGRPDILLLEIGEQLPDSGTWESVSRAKRGKNLPVIALVPAEMLDRIDRQLEVDDLLISPYDTRELNLRIDRLLRSTKDAENREQIKSTGLVIDPTTCEVMVEGKIVELTFKEYELLKLLASNRGRVYTRQALLDKIWGYDYFGGDRTVDVHIRRLRSKIEDASHTYIETVRNIGYRFTKHE